MEDIVDVLVNVGWWRTSAIELVKRGIAFTETRNSTHYMLCDFPGHYHHVPVTVKNSDCNNSGPTWEGKYA